LAFVQASEKAPLAREPVESGAERPGTPPSGGQGRVDAGRGRQSQPRRSGRRARPARPDRGALRRPGRRWSLRSQTAVRKGRFKFTVHSSKFKVQKGLGRQPAAPFCPGANEPIVKTFEL